MKKYLNKALLYKEWKNIWWFILPLTLLNIRVLEMINTIYYAKKHLGNYYNGILMFFSFGYTAQTYFFILAIVIMSYFVASRDRLDSVNSLLNYMPFSKNQRMFAKCIVGIAVIFISGIIGAVINSIVFGSNYTYLKRIIKFKYIVGFFAITVLAFSIVYLILMCVQCLCKNSVFAVMLGVSVINFPSSLETIIGAAFVKWFGKSAGSTIDKIMDNLCILSYLKIHVRTKTIGHKTYLVSDAVLPIVIKLIVFAIVIGMILIYTIKKVDVNEDIMLKATSKKETMFRVFSSVTIGFLAANGMSRIIGTYRVMYIFVINIIFIAIGYFAYGRIDKFIKLSRYGWGE